MYNIKKHKKMQNITIETQQKHTLDIKMMLILLGYAHKVNKC